METKISAALQSKGPLFCNIEVEQTHRVIPQVKFGRPNEDAEPLLSRQEFKSNMLIELVD